MSGNDEARIAVRRAQAAGWIEPVVLACGEDRRFFEELGDEPRALVTLWALAARAPRGGVATFVEQDPAWLVRDVPRAARLLGAGALGDGFEVLVAALSGAKGAARLSARGIDWSAHGGLDTLVPALADSLPEQVLARKGALGAVRARAESIHATARERRTQEGASAAVPVAPVPVPTGRRTKAQKEWDELRPRARAWSASVRFAVGDGIVHAKFGLGRVRALVPPNKIEVELEEGSVRTLVHAG